jgi:transcription termination factor Rho
MTTGPSPEQQATGLLELDGHGAGYLRSLRNNFLPAPDDPRVPHRLIEAHQLREGLFLAGTAGLARPHRGRRGGGPPAPELAAVESINGYPLAEVPPVHNFVDLTSVNPDRYMRLSGGPTTDNLSMRVIDLITPVGRGQRGLIVAAPKTGKTILLEQIGRAVAELYAEVHLIVLLIDERPEEVTHMKRNIRGEVVASSADSTSASHLRLARLMLERARRLVELGKDVVILLDSITRLGRASNREQRGKGKTMTGGIDSRALGFPRQFFGAARNTEDAGSLTILGTALVDTGSQMDEVIFQEFKGTGNMELVLDRRIAEARIFPAIDISRSGTRREEMLFSAEELPKIHLLRRALAELKPTEAMNLLLERMKKTRNNQHLLESIRLG